MRTTTAAAIVLAVLLTARPSAAQEVEEAPTWTDEARLAAAQCIVAEARFRNRTEHSIILHVLARRQQSFNEAHPSGQISFETEIRRYCHVHRAPREESANGWVLGLPWGPMTEDPGMPSGTDWRRFRDDWDFARETVSMFERGELRDPMPLAVHFGGAMDGANVGLLVNLGPWTTSIQDGQHVLLHNRFYALRSTVERAAARRARSRS